MIVQFFLKKGDTKPEDAYTTTPSMLGFAVANWLKMHPAGRVEILSE